MRYCLGWVGSFARFLVVFLVSLSLIVACSGENPNPEEVDTTQDGSNTKDDSTGKTEKPPIGTTSSALTVTPSGSFKLAVGGEVDLKAQVFNEQGIPQYNSKSNPITVTWSSSDGTVASVSPEGLVQGLKLGTATITAQIQNTNQKTTVIVEVVQFTTDLSAIFLNPTRLAMDLGSSRKFNVSAVDSSGAPTTLDCDKGATVTFDNKYVTANYDGTTGSENVTVDGTKKGFSLLTLDCNGFKSSPAIIEVKPSVTIPDPSPSANGDFGIEPSIAIKDKIIHMVSYDRTNKKLIYSQFQGRWTSVTLDGSGDYGRQSAIALDHANDKRPLICAVEDKKLSCWSLNGAGFWKKTEVDDLTDNPGAYKGEINVAVNGKGEAFVLYYHEKSQALKLAVSSDNARQKWVSQEISKGGVFNSIVLASDGKPRVAIQRDDKAYYGAQNPGGKWLFEAIDDGSGTPAPGTGIQLGLGDNNRPQVIYYKNGNLIHAVKASDSWGVAVIETVQVGSYSFGLAINRHNQPRVSYYDGANKTLRYAYRLKRKRLGAVNQWRIETPLSGSQVGNFSGLALDDFGRAHIAYYNESNKQAGYYVEPHFLDYSPTLDTGKDPISNTIVSECQTDTDCQGQGRPAGLTCQQNSCTCPGGKTVCGTSCVDIQTDADNCGACSNKCKAQGATCNAGTCTCPGGKTDCNGICVDTQTDGKNCGTCGTICVAQNSSCDKGVCVCPGGKLQCVGQCVDVKTDANHCGACGNKCTPQGTPCDAGKCGCPTGKVVCNGQCADLQSDKDNCGTCGTQCTNGQTCQSGTCKCPTGFSICSGQCVDLKKDNSNCGTCGTACSGGTVCQNGACGCSGTNKLCGGKCVDSLTDNNNCGSCGATCSSTQKCCGGSCQSIQTDKRHCGSCGKVCSIQGEVCQSGACTCPTNHKNCQGACVNILITKNHCGSCGSSCGSGQSCCGGKCLNTQSDNRNCGACGNVCTGGRSCQSGVCACPSGQNFCGGSCVNPQSENNHCGGCGKACGAGQACCNGVCKDLLTDKGNCGSCGNVCTTQGAICQTGKCGCPTGQTRCNSKCVDTKTDKSFCGSCNTKCQLGQECCGGACVFVGGSNPAHCGSCNKQCPPGQGCFGGICNCPPGTTYCSNQCVTTSTDKNNCGTCGTVCKLFCKNSTCIHASQLSVGRSHSCVVLSDGTGWCWGLGYKRSPSHLNGLVNIKQISAGTRTGAAVLNNGTVKYWSTGNSPILKSGITTAIQISTGVHETCAVLANGTVSCWPTSSSSSPKPVANLSNVKQVSAGFEHSCAVLKDGTARCWGYNHLGQLGNGMTNRYGTVVGVVQVQGLNNVKQISAGYDYSCALLSNGTVKCWGSNFSGKLGNGTLSSGAVVLADKTQNTSRTCAVLQNGSVQCWGQGSSSPKTISQLSNVLEIGIGLTFMCALLKDGTLVCWGDNDNSGQLGNNSTLPSSIPVRVQF